MKADKDRKYKVLKRLAEDAELCNLPLELVIKVCEENYWQFQLVRSALLATADTLASLDS